MLSSSIRRFLIAFLLFASAMAGILSCSTQKAVQSQVSEQTSESDAGQTIEPATETKTEEVQKQAAEPEEKRESQELAEEKSSEKDASSYEPERKLEPEQEPKSESGQEDVQREGETESVSGKEPSLEIGPSPEIESPSEIGLEPEAEHEPEPEAEPEPEPEPEPEAEHEPEPEAEPEPEPEPEPEAEPEVEPEVEPVLETDSELEFESESETESLTEVEKAPESDTEYKPVAEMVPKSEQPPKTEIEPEIEPAPEIEPVSVVALEPESETVHEAEQMHETEPEYQPEAEQSAPEVETESEASEEQGQHYDYESEAETEWERYARMMLAKPTIIRSEVYSLFKPIIERSLVFDLSAPVIESAYVKEDDSNYVSRKLLIMSITNSSPDELGFIAGKYSVSASADAILSKMGLTSDVVSRINSSEEAKAKSKSDTSSGEAQVIKEDSSLPADEESLLSDEFVEKQEDVLDDSASGTEIEPGSESESASVINSEDEDKLDAGDDTGTEVKPEDKSEPHAGGEGEGEIKVEDESKLEEENKLEEEAKAESASPSASYDFSVDCADQVELYKVNKKDFIRLDGNVRISFMLSGQNRVLSADSILYDVSENEIVASGHISISSHSSDSQSLQDLVAEHLSINLNDNTVRLIEATGKTEKSNQNIKSSYYMSGDLLVIDNKTSEIYFDSGSLLPSFSPYTSNWAISANKIIMKNNGDVLLSGLMLKIGRVPFPIPFPLPLVFILPGTPLTLNPAIGFSSSKGAFVNLTYEVYGSYPQIGNSGEKGNSLTNLLKSDASGTMVKKGILYSYDEEVQSSSSNKDYMAAFCDFYADQGVFVGVDTKNTFFGKLNMSGKAGIAYKPQSAKDNPGSSDYRNLRYFFDIDNLSMSNIVGLNISAKVPFYSDPNVGYDYLNRLTAFSIDSLFLSSLDFPSSVSKSVSERKYSLSLSYSKSFKFKVIESISASADVNYSRYWAAPTEPGGYYSYASGEFTLPSASMRISGTLFSFTRSDTSSASVKRSINENFEELDDSQKREQELLLMRDKIKALNVKKVSSIEAKVIESSEYDGMEKDLDKLIEDDAATFADRMGYVHNQEEYDRLNAKTLEQTDSTADPKTQEQESGESKVEDENKVSVEGMVSQKYSLKASVSDESASGKSFFTGSHISMKYSFSDTFSNVFLKPSDRESILGPRKTSNNLSGTVTMQGGIGNNIFSFTETLTPNYQYSFLESSSNLTTHEFSLRSNLTSSLSIPLSLPNISVSYTMSSVLYTYKSTKDDNTPEKNVTEKVFSWDSESISAHKVGVSMSFKSFVTASVDTSLPPMESFVLTPNMSVSFLNVTLRGSHSMSGPEYSSLKSTKTTGSVSYSKTPFSISFSAEYDYDKNDWDVPGGFFKPFTFSHNSSISLFSSWLNLSESVQFVGLTTNSQRDYFQSIQLNASLKQYFSASFTVSGAYDALELTRTTLKLSVPEFSVALWKNRIVLILGFSTTANIDFNDAFQNSLSYSFSLEFHIRELLKLTIGLNGVNNNFMAYTGGERFGKFNFGTFLADIFRGLNFLSPDIATSQFKMESLNVALEHDMGDFIFEFTFKGKFELNVNEYEWKPEYTILLKWGVIPELKIDKTVKP